MKYWSSRHILWYTYRHTYIHTDTLHKKIQTASFIRNAFSEAVNLAHILKIRVSTPPYEQAFETGQALFGRKAATLYSVSSHPIVFALPHWLCRPV